EEALERADLIDEAVGELFTRDLHFTPAKALEVGEGGMGPYLDAVFLGEAHGGAHMVEVRAVEAASDIGDIDMGHEPLIIAHFIEAESLAHVTVYGCHLSSSPHY